MDKKSLVAFMMTAPVMSVFASNWGYTNGTDNGLLSYTVAPEIGQANWVSNDNSLPQPGVAEESKVDKLVLSKLCPSISSTFTLPRGSYQLTTPSAKMSNAILCLKTGSTKKYFAKTNGAGKYVDANGKVLADQTDVANMVATSVNERVTLKSDTQVIVTIYQQDELQTWSIGDVEFAFQFNFKKAYDKLNGDLTDAGNDVAAGNGIQYPNEASRKAQIDALKNRFKALENEYKRLSPMVTACNYQANEVKKGEYETEEQVCDRLIASYNTYHLYNTPNDITPSLDELLDNFDNYRTDVAAENEIGEAINVNTTNLSKFTDKNTGYYKQIEDALKNPVDGFKDQKLPSGVSGAEKQYLEYIAKNAKANLSTALANLKANVTSAYADLTNPDVDFASLKNQAESILKQIQALGNGYAGAQNDWKSYNYFLSNANTPAIGILTSEISGEIKNLADVALVQTSVFQQIDKFGHNNYNGYNALYSDLINDYKAKLNDIYKSNKGYTINQEGGLTPTNPNIAGAYLNYVAANEDMLKRIEDMPKVADEFNTFITLQNNKYADASKVVKGAEATVNGNSIAIADVIGLITSPGFSSLDENVQIALGGDAKTGVVGLIPEISSTYEALKTALSDLYEAHDLWDESEGDYNKTYSDALVAFNEAVQAYEVYMSSPANAGLVGSIEVMNDFEETKSFVTETMSDLTNGTTIEGLFTDSYTKVGNWVKDYVAQVGVVNTAKTNATAAARALSAAQTEKTNADAALTQANADLTSANKTLNEAIVDRNIKQQVYQDMLASGTQEVEKLEQARENLNNANEAVEQAQAAVAAAQTAVNNAKTRVANANKALDTATTNNTDAQNALTAANQKLTALKDAIDSGCQEIEDNATALHNGFEPLETNVTALSKAVAALKSDIDNVSSKVVKTTVSGNPAYTYKQSDVTVAVSVNGAAAKNWNETNFANQANSFDTDLKNIAAGKTVTIAGTKYNCKNPTEFLDAAEALNDAVVNDGGTTYTDYVGQARLKLAKAIASANLAAIEALDELLNTNVDELKAVNAPGAANITVSANFKPGYSGYPDITTAKTNVNAALASTDINALTTADDKMIQFAEAYQISLETVKPVYNNYISWRLLRNALGLSDAAAEVSGAIGSTMNPTLNDLIPSVDLIDNATKYVNAISDPLAQPYYQAELQKIHDEVIAEGETVTASYKAMDANKDYATLLDEIKAINAKITNLEKACLANQTQYGALTSKVDNLSKLANTVYDYINNNDEVDSNKKDYLDQVTAEINKLKDLSVELTNSFKNGAVVADDAADQKNYSGRLKAIEDKLNEIEAGESAGYKQAVIDANKAFLNKRGMSYDYLYEQYKIAVDTVNHYRYDIQNANYYAALVGNEDFQKAHYALQNTYIDLEEFNKTYAPWFASLTAGNDRSKYVVLSTFIDAEGKDLLPEYQPAKMPSAEEQKTLLATYNQYLEDAKELRGDIETKLNTCTNVAYGIATNYFAEKYTNSGAKNYANTRTGLIDAGLTHTGKKGCEVYTALASEALGNMALAYKNIQNVYFGNSASDYATAPDAYKSDKNLSKKALEKKSKYEYILGLSSVANNIDVLNPTVQSGLSNEQFVAEKVNTGVANQWTSLYDDTMEELLDYQKKAATDSGYGDAETLAKAIANAQSINAEWVAYVVKAATCADNYKAYKDKLLNNKEINSALETGRNWTVDLKKAAVEKALIGPDAASCLSKTNADLAELLEFSGYHTAQLNTIDNLQGDVNNLKAQVENALKAGVPDQEYYEDEFEALQDDIAAAYQTIFNQECTYANSMLLAKAKTAFNNAKVNNANIDFDQYNTIINGIAAAVDNLKATTVTPENRETLKGEIENLENQYCEVIETLDKAAGTAAERTDLGVATTTFNTLYANDLAEVNRYLDAVNAATDKYGEYSAATTAEYAPQLETLKGELEALQPELAKAGIDLIYTIDEFKYKFAQISEKAQDINEAWTIKNAEDQIFYTSDQRYAEYDAQLNGLLADIETAHKQLIENNPEATDGDYTALLNKVNQPEVGLRATLDELKAEHGFTTDYNPVDNFDIEATAYVKKTLTTVFKSIQNKNSWTIWNEYVAVFENENISNENEQGWKYDYLHGTELMEKLLAARDEMDALTNDPIIKIADPTEADPKNERATTANEAVAGYDSLVAQMNAILANVDSMLKGELGEKYLKGDIDGDGDLTVADVQKLITIVGEGVEYVPGDSESETENVNGDNAINIADVTALINKILDKSNNGSRIARFGQAESGDNSFVCEEIQGENGMRRFAISLNNEVDFAAGQIDIMLPAGSYVAGVQLGDRANALDSYVFENDGYTRVLMTSLDNAMIQGNSGTVLYIDVEGNDDIEVANVIFSDKNGVAHEVASNSGTGVGIMDAVKDGVKAIYNAAGQKLNKLTKGVNIIRNADGTTAKKIGK